MIFTDSRQRGNLLLLIALVSWQLPQISHAQETGIENSVFWEIKREDLKTPSYLFGTFHLMGSRYIDSLTQVTFHFKNSKTMVGELLIDSTMAMKMMTAARLDNTTLDKLLGPEDFKLTAAWLKALSGYDLMMFNGMNPMTIQIFLMTMLQQKYYPIDANLDTPMDMYFQKVAKKGGKKLEGLETFDVQVNALFHQFSIARQAEMLMSFVHEKDKCLEELIKMNKSYRSGDLTSLSELLSEQTYSHQEAEVLLDNRNKKWMEQLPILMKEQQTFIAVGALHLAGKNGLVSLLRKAGYTVTPIPTK